MKGKGTLIFLIVFFIGVCVFCYPMFSQYWNSRLHIDQITVYDDILSANETKDYTEEFNKAYKYNKKLNKLTFPLTQYKNLKNYDDIINVNGAGMMGYVSIDKIKVELPIYHGTSARVLNSAVGHMQGTSLPVGGKSTHSVLSAHRGLSSAKLFTDLGKLEVGDIFTVTVYDQKLTYQIDQVLIVEPNDITYLQVVNGEDYLTLVTCTPYGLNTHRLLVRGTRIENPSQMKLTVTNEAYRVDKLVVTSVTALPILLILIIYVMVKPVNNKRRDDE